MRFSVNELKPGGGSKPAGLHLTCGQADRCSENPACSVPEVQRGGYFDLFC